MEKYNLFRVLNTFQLLDSEFDGPPDEEFWYNASIKLWEEAIAAMRKNNGQQGFGERTLIALCHRVHYFHRIRPALVRRGHDSWLLRFDTLAKSLFCQLLMETKTRSEVKRFEEVWPEEIRVIGEIEFHGEDLIGTIRIVDNR